MCSAARRSNRSAVSPVLATVLMVVVTIVLSAVLLVMVMGFMDPVETSPFGFFSDIGYEDPDTYPLTMGTVTSPLTLDETRVEINGAVSTLTLDGYVGPSNAFTTPDGLFVFYVLSHSADGTLSTGDVLVLETDPSVRGSPVGISLLFTGTGTVAVQGSFLARGTADYGIDLEGAVTRGGAAAAFPLTLTASSSQSVSVPQGNVGPVLQSFTVTATVRLNKAPAEQSSWATILNCNGDNGYRLQLSGDSTSNAYFEFGTKANWIRSDGTGTPNPALSIGEGVWYTVMGEYRVSERVVRIYVNNSDGVMVLCGQRSVSGTASVLGSSYWHIGGAGSGTTAGSRFFDGTVSSLSVVTS